MRDSREDMSSFSGGRLGAPQCGRAVEIYYPRVRFPVGVECAPPAPPALAAPPAPPAARRRGEVAFRWQCGGWRRVVG